MSPLFPIFMARACCALIVSALLPFPAGAAPIKLKFSFFSSDREYAYESVVKPFVNAVNLEGKGIVEIELFPSGALGRSYAQQAQLVLSGDADIAWINPALTPEQFPDNSVIELPGLFRDANEAAQVYTRMAGSGSLKGYEDFFLIAAMSTEPLTIHTRSPIASLDDLKGKRIRTGRQTEVAVLRALGMEPVMMPIIPVADAINSGAIDGASAALEVLIDFGISRFTTYHYRLDLGTVPLAIIMNRKKFDSLPTAAQDVIRKFSGAWPVKHYIDAINAYDAEILERLKSDPRRKVIYPSPRDLAVARDVFDTVATQWAGSNPRNRTLLDKVDAEIAEFRSVR
jgi:TRAP-type C4-dicarboxylate transport system substrate-binding protein